MAQKVTAIMDSYLSKVVEIPFSEKAVCRPGDMVVSDSSGISVCFIELFR